MPPEDIQSLPFLTRKTLDCEHASSLGVQIDSQSSSLSRITLRGATKTGPFEYQHEPTSDSIPKSESFALPDIPIWITAVVEGVGILQGQTYAQISLIINGDIIHHLCSGYLSSNFGISWPSTNLQPSVPDIGFPASFNGADPAAGTEISITVPSYQLRVVNSVRFTLVASANAASRIVHLLFTTSGNVIAECISNTAQIISQTRVYTAFPTTPGGSLADDNDIIIPIPSGIILPPGGTITTMTTALNASDDYGVPIATFKRYF